MKISVFGMGYVGCVTAACLAESGHEVWGVDVNQDKIEMIKAGKSPVIEDKIDAMIARASLGGHLRATMDSAEAVRTTEVSLVCVGTPSHGNGSADLGALTAAARQIGAALNSKASRHCVVFRSTTMPGTIRHTLIPVLQTASGKQAHRGFDVCMNPEFLREGSAVSDFYHPPFIVIGEHTTQAGESVARIYDGLNAPVEHTTYEVAEILKYACNAFHALKITFANEIGTLCKSLALDGHHVMQLFTMDRKLNISSAYLRPGFAFGGSCLPKDLRALLHKARQNDLSLPLLSSILESNRLHLDRVLDRILATGEKRIGILGLSFKAGTDDLRESPSVALIETLIGKGFQVKIYDPDVLLARIFGANKRFIEQEIPHISCLMCSDLDTVIQESDVLVISKPVADCQRALATHPGRFIIDLVHLPFDGAPTPANYDGVCW